jgi:hypothetical protein
MSITLPPPIATTQLKSPSLKSLTPFLTSSNFGLAEKSLN